MTGLAPRDHRVWRCAREAINSRNPHTGLPCLGQLPSTRPFARSGSGSVFASPQAWSQGHAATGDAQRGYRSFHVSKRLRVHWRAICPLWSILAGRLLHVRTTASALARRVSALSVQSSVSNRDLRTKNPRRNASPRGQALTQWGHCSHRRARGRSWSILGLRLFLLGSTGPI